MSYGKFLNSKSQKLKIESAITDIEVHFKAFLNDLSQTFQSNWQTEDVYGRNDPIATFASTKRTISLSWDVPSKDASEAKDNLESCNKLIAMAYPAYTPSGVTGIGIIAKNPLVKVKFGNLVCDSGGDPLLGWMDSINWKPALDMGMFNPSAGKFYPKVISLSFNLNVLHQESLGQEKKATAKFPFKI